MEIDFNGNPFGDRDNVAIKSDVESAYDRTKYTKVNTVSEKSYSLINNGANPFNIGDKVTLDFGADERYSFIQNVKEGDVPRVSGVLGESMVNIGFSYTQPMTVKSVNVADLVIHKASPFATKVRVFIKSIKLVTKLLVFIAQYKLKRSAMKRIKRMK